MTRRTRPAVQYRPTTGAGCVEWIAIIGFAVAVFGIVIAAAHGIAGR
jgi:hypothetical protein